MYLLAILSRVPQYNASVSDVLKPPETLLYGYYVKYEKHVQKRVNQFTRFRMPCQKRMTGDEGTQNT